MRGSLKHYAGRAAIKSKIVEDATATRLRLANHFNQLFDAQVRYGPFKGFRFSPTSWWSAIDRAGMLLGLYEQEVLNALVSASEKRSIFIDIGAADGYYGVAAVSQRLFERSLCFEMTQAGQSVIRANAELNGVSDLVSVYGEADIDTLEGIPASQRDQSVVLIDIEGAEFEFLSERVIELLKNSVLIIELHDWLHSAGDELRASLQERLKPHFSTQVLTTSSRDLSEFVELEELPDTERWLLCSEGRGRLMQWWVLTPL
ncbi:MAG: hypothetical protein ACR2PZ_13390 [Pseudomonadales bacterium]